MALDDMIGDFGTVIKIDVSNLEHSVEWYSDKLQLTEDKKFREDIWRQLSMPGPSKMAFGLLLNPEGVVEGTKKATFVVTDLERARQNLIDKGVEVDEIKTLGEWVRLAFFCDPDGNVFGLRQNL
jgi:predicted enzyme related to lactoylglutathione lyase